MLNNRHYFEESPEKYYQDLENEYGVSTELDIDKVVQDLLKAGRDKNKFKIIMENIHKDFLGEDKLSDSEVKHETHNNQKSFTKNKFNYDTSLQHTNKNWNKNERPEIRSNFEASHQKENNMMNPSRLVVNHKKYTDVHANTKYYYPTEYSNTYDGDEFSISPSQWTDRANRNVLYSKNHENFNNKNNQSLHSFYDTGRNEQQYHSNNNNNYSNRFIKDNANSSYYNRQTGTSKYGLYDF